MTPDQVDPALAAMERECARSMDGLRVPGSPRPYFIQYTLRAEEALDLRGSYGALSRCKQDARTKLFVDLRVGSHAFDNLVDGGLDARAGERESADWLDGPQDLDPTALAVACWKLTQIKFDEALKDYYDHRKTTVTEYLRDAVDSFSRERPLRHVEPVSAVAFPVEAWSDAVASASRRFLDAPRIYDPEVALRVRRIHRLLVTSEGTRVVTAETFLEFDVSGWILSEDGVYVEGREVLHARDLADAPGPGELHLAVDRVLADLHELQDADTPGAYVGPALLGGQAAATVFHEALGHRLEGERLVARGETRTFARKRGESILPPGIDVYDDPTQTHGAGTPVWGGYAVDDQGVAATRADLVEDGKLVGFLHSRTPSPMANRSNGHGRHDGVAPPMARMANLCVESAPSVARPRARLEEQLVALARERGLKQALVIDRIESGETSTSSYDFQAFKGEPSRAHLIDVETGARRRIRDVSLIGTPLSALQRVIGVGGVDESAEDVGYCYAESGAVPVCGRAPPVLLSELELSQSSTSGFHEPLLPPPFADDGSRGRAPGPVRARGRRRRRG